MSDSLRRGVDSIRLIVRYAPLHDEWDDIEIDKTIRRVKNFNVPAQNRVGFGECFPIEPAHLFLERFAHRVLSIQSEKFAGPVIQIGDAAVRIGDDDSFLNGVEDRLEKTFLLREAEEIVLHLLWPNPAEAAN